MRLCNSGYVRTGCGAVGHRGRAGFDREVAHQHQGRRCAGRQHDRLPAAGSAINGYTLEGDWWQQPVRI